MHDAGSMPFQTTRTFEAKGRSTSSVTSSASISARKATTGPGLAPVRRPPRPYKRLCPAPRTELRKMLDDQCRRAELAVAQLGILVNVAPPRDHLSFDCFGLLIDCITNRIGVTGAARRDHKYCKGQDHRSSEFHGGSPFTALTTEETSMGWNIREDRARRQHALCR